MLRSHKQHGSVHNFTMRCSVKCSQVVLETSNKQSSWQYLGHVTFQGQVIKVT